MCSRAMHLAYIESKGPYIGSRAAFDVESGRGAVDPRHLELEYLHFGRFEIHWFVFSRKLMGRSAVNFLRGIRRRNLLNLSQKLRGEGGDLFGAQCRGGVWSERFAVGVVSIRFKSETHRAGVALAAT